MLTKMCTINRYCYTCQDSSFNVDKAKFLFEFVVQSSGLIFRRPYKTMSHDGRTNAIIC